MACKSLSLELVIQQLAVFLFLQVYQSHCHTESKLIVGFSCGSKSLLFLLTLLHVCLFRALPSHALPSQCDINSAGQTTIGIAHYYVLLSICHLARQCNYNLFNKVPYNAFQSYTESKKRRSCAFVRRWI